MKMNILFLAAAFMMFSCNDDDETMGNVPTEIISPAVSMTAQLTLNISTDKALYNPGESIRFSAEGSVPSGARVRYRHGNEVIADETLSSSSWTWTAPQTDYTGYLVDVYTVSGNSETIYGTVGVDVSSNWAKFPRYGFVSSFDRSKTSSVIAEEMAFLNRCHINGVQFYDWHYKHQWPLGGTREVLMDSYTDIANREVVTSVVKDYISQQHGYGMKTMFYNLCYGVLDDTAQDGVDEKWGVFTNTTHTRDKHSLPSGWKGDIYLVDPSNKDWQHYLADRNDEVYANFDFDGFHIDQLGSRGTVYDYYGSQLNLTHGLGSFINAMKDRHQNKHLVMNAVSGYGANEIGKTDNTEFMYTEMWGSEDQFSDIHEVIAKNRSYSNGKNTVLAAYMNYGKSSSQGWFNTPGILLTDAVMFALGGSHLELGDGHMLSHEYFPNSNLKMSEELRQNIIRYYDFLVAYQNLLRDGGEEVIATLASGNSSVSINAWPPKLNTVISYAKKVDNKEVVHLLNFMNANSLSWRDMQGNMPAPQQISNLPLRMKVKGVKKLWVASPDHFGGAPQELNFSQDGGYVNFTLPSLNYWTMIVVEY